MFLCHFQTALAEELLRISKLGGGKVDNDRFVLEMLEVLVKGGKDAQSISIREKSKPKIDQSTPADRTANIGHDNPSASMKELMAELDETRRSLKETQRELSDKSEQLEVVFSERDELQRVSKDHDAAATSETTYSVTTPSKAIGMSRMESIQDIVTGLGEEDAPDADGMSLLPDTIVEGLEHGGAAPLVGTNDRIKELNSEVNTLRMSLERHKQALDEKVEELEAAKEECQVLRETLRNTPDIDEETIHYIVKNITSYDEQRMEAFRLEDGGDVSHSVESSSISSFTPVEEDELQRQRKEDMESFVSAMFSTGKFLVDFGMFQDSIACFETVLEARRRAYGWDDPLVGDSLHSALKPYTCASFFRVW